MTKPLQVGLIGFGMAGQVFHAPVIVSVPGLHLAKIRESRPENITIANKRFPQAEIVKEADDLISDSSIDLVVVATSNTSHFDLAKKALEAGKHVVVEKPFTITSAEADRLIEIAKKQDRILTVHHNRRFDGDFSTVKKILKEGWLGRLVEVEMHFDRFRNFMRPNAWREENLPGSGIFFDLGPHLIDQVLVLFGWPTELTAFIGTQRDGAKADDHFEVIMHYPKLKVTLKGGMLVREAGPHYMFYGDQGSYIKHGLDPQEAALKAGKIPAEVPEWGVEAEAEWGTINTDFKGVHIKGKVETDKGNYPGFYANVRDAILGNAPLEVTAEQSRDTIRIIELAFKSSAEKRTLRM